MSCELCKGGEDVQYVSIKTKAENYVLEYNCTVVIYFDGLSFDYMEAQAFYKKPIGQLIEIISFVRKL